MRDFTAPDLVFDHLNLGALSTINQKKIGIHRNYLAGRVTVESRNCRIITENGYCEHYRGLNDLVDYIDEMQFKI